MPEEVDEHVDEAVHLADGFTLWAVAIQWQFGAFWGFRLYSTPAELTSQDLQDLTLSGFPPPKKS